MDINPHKFTTNSNWCFDMTMEDEHHILHNNQLPLDHPFWPNNYPLHTHQIPSSSSSPSIQLPVSGLFGDHHQMGINPTGEDQQEEEPEEELGAMKEMMYKIAAMQPVDIDPSTIRKPKRRNIRISDDPQSVAARHRRERISEKIRILQRLVPGGTKMDTASMLDEAIRYVKFLKRQIRLLQSNNHHPPFNGVTGNLSTAQDWLPINTPNKGLAYATTTTSPPEPQLAGFTGQLEGTSHDTVFCFNHEVISD